MSVPELDLETIQRWCARETFPLQDRTRIEVEVTRNAVTIMEVRLLGEGSAGSWSRVPVARLRYETATGQWALYRSDGNARFRRYEPVPATRQVQTLLDYLTFSGDPLFWS